MKISIITVVFNREKTIETAIESVLSQRDVDIEYNIKDGESSDGTLKIVESYSTLPKVNVLSKSDKNVYDAFNQGLDMCKGDVIGFLHSDDEFVDEFVLKDLIPYFETHDIVYGNTIFVDQSNKIVRKWKGKEGNINLGWAPPHTAVFVKKSVYDKHGNFNTSYSISADYDFLIRVFKDKSIKTKYLDRDIIYMRTGGISTSGFNANLTSFKEIQKIYKSNHIKFPIFKQIIRLFRRLMQFTLFKGNVEK
jgi:glycosyltransferase